MRKVLTAGVLTVFMAATVSFAEMKIGYINSEMIFTEYEGTKVAQEKFNKEVAKWEQDASKMQKDLKDLKDQLDKQSLLLSAERKKELEDSLNTKMVAYQEFLQKKFGQKGEALTKNEELTKPILERIQKIIDKIAADENFDFIFDARAGGLVHAKATYDLNKRVLELLSKEK